MLSTVKLLLPALIPSWNFFDVIAASPRIEYALLADPGAADRIWLEFRPRPQRISPADLAMRLFWNARWNETLFVVSCAERLLADPTAHSVNEIFRRVGADIRDTTAEIDAAGWIQFRIALLSEQDGVIVKEIAFVSACRRIADIVGA